MSWDAANEQKHKQPPPIPHGLKAEALSWWLGHAYDESPSLVTVPDDEADAVASTIYLSEKGSFRHAPVWEDAAEDDRRYYEARARWYLAVARDVRQRRAVKANA